MDDCAQGAVRSTLCQLFAERSPNVRQRSAKFRLESTRAFIKKQNPQNTMSSSPMPMPSREELEKMWHAMQGAKNANEAVGQLRRSSSVSSQDASPPASAEKKCSPKERQARWKLEVRRWQRAAGEISSKILPANVSVYPLVQDKSKLTAARQRVWATMSPPVPRDISFGKIKENDPALHDKLVEMLCDDKVREKTRRSHSFPCWADFSCLWMH
jgi:hypothetical protein